MARRRAKTTLLTPEQLRWNCPPQTAAKRTPRVSDLLGQERPLKALETGARLHAPGYNIYVSGCVGSGRTRLVTDLLEKINPQAREIPDRVFVSNFRDPARPRLVSLPPGEGPRFREEMRELVHSLQEALASGLRSRTHQVSRDLVLRAADEREQRLMAALDRQARSEGCAVVQFPSPNGGMLADIYPIYEGEPVNPEALRELVVQGAMPKEQWLRVRSRRELLMERLESVTERLLGMSRETEHELRSMDRQVAEHMLAVYLREFVKRWPQDEIRDFIQTMREFILEDLDYWVTPPETPAPRPDSGGHDPHHDDPHAEMPEAPPPGVRTREAAPRGNRELGARQVSRGGGSFLDGGPVDGLGHDPGGAGAVHAPDPVRMFGIEVHLVKTSTGDACPIVVETHPTYTSLFGTVESARDGHMPGLLSVHPGAMVRADGGFLILRMPEVMAEPGLWTHLKRALKVRCVEIRERDPNTGASIGSLTPEAVPIDLKVILIGDTDTYEALANEDPQFLQIFKVHAEFDTSVPVTKANLRRYANLLEWLSQVEGLRSFTPEANAAVIEIAARAAGQRDRLTTRFGQLADLAREASFLAEEDGAERIERDHVLAALHAWRFRRGLGRELMQRDFKQGYLLIKTKGAVVGQINAMTVVEMGTTAFGKPGRITAVTGAGSPQRSHLVNIEREAELSGPLYDKGIMILEGFLLDRFAQDKPICMQATLCFEQTYHGIDGDSASLAELLAILSSLAKVPIKQGLAVTGSLNQRGEVQSVSGVNSKIEGFFQTCQAQGLDGKQGVILPRTNIDDLMLDESVVEAVRAGKFHVHVVDTVEQAIELMMDTPAKEVLSAAGERLQHFSGGSGR